MCINRFAGYGSSGEFLTERKEASSPPPVQVLLFATARTAVGERRLEWAVGIRGMPLAELLGALGARHPALRPILRTSRVLVNGDVRPGAVGRVRPGDELAIHPPYGGG